MTAVVTHTNGATAEETSQRRCLACDKAFTPGTGQGRYCGRRCATIHGNQTAAMARASELVEDFEERLHRAIAQQLDRVLTLTITETVDAVAPAIVQREVAAVVPAAVKKEVAEQLKLRAEALASQADKQPAVAAPKRPPRQEGVPTNHSAQNAELEEAIQALSRKLHSLPHGWQQAVIQRGASGYQVKIAY